MVCPHQGDGAADAGLAGCVGLLGQHQVGPLEAEEFAGAGSSQNGHDEEGLEAALGFSGGFEEPDDLLDGEGWPLLPGSAWRGLGVAGYVVGDQTLLYGALVRDADGGVDVADGAGSLAGGAGSRRASPGHF